MSKPSKYVIRTTAKTPGVRTRHFFTSRELARAFAKRHGLPYSQIKPN